MRKKTRSLSHLNARLNNRISRAKKQLEEQAQSKGIKVTFGQEYKTVLKGFSYATYPKDDTTSTIAMKTKCRLLILFSHC